MYHASLQHICGFAEPLTTNIMCYGNLGLMFRENVYSVHIPVAPLLLRGSKWWQTVDVKFTVFNI